jgi:hypothetical protein
VFDGPAVQAQSASDRGFADKPIAGKPIDVDYISDTGDSTMALDRLLTIGEVGGNNVFEMVDVILGKAKGRPIRKLTITGHGSPGHQEIGRGGSLHTVMGGKEKDALGKLKGHFAPDAEVVLHGCQVAAGQAGEKLLTMLSQILGVPVRGGVAIQRLPPGIEGNEVTAAPDGKGGTKLRTNERFLHNTFINDNGSFSDDDEYRKYWEAEPDYRWEAAGVDDRYKAVKTWVNGYTSKAEGELILKMFRLAKSGDRKELYRLLEGHPWAGDFKHGLLTSDDALWNSLTTEQLGTLRKLMNS